MPVDGRFLVFRCCHLEESAFFWGNYWRSDGHPWLLRPRIDEEEEEVLAEAASWSQNSMNTTAIRENKGKNGYSGESAKGF